MENKENKVEAKKSSTKKVLKYAAFAAAAVGLGFILGNKETRDKIGSSINKLTAPKAVELEGEPGEPEASHEEQRPRKEWRNNNKDWRSCRQSVQQQSN